MNFFTYRISLDIRETTSQAFINVKKNDTARKFIFTLTDNGRAYQITEGCTAVFRAKKPDGTILYNNCPIVGNAMEYYLTSQTVAAVGIVECEITLYGSNSKQITSPRFSLAVDDVLYSDSEVESKDEFTALTGAIDEVRASKAFTIKLTTTSDGITADKTFAEIAEKVNAAKSVVINMDGWVFPVSYSADSGKIVFSSLWANIAEIPNTVTFAVNSSNAWNVVVSDIPTTAQVSAKYTKPASGIPKADLANDVQASLDKAENAVEYFEVTLTTQNGVSTADKTFEQVKAAVEDGIPALKVHSDGDISWFFLLDKSPTEIDFIGFVDEQIIAYLTAKQDGTWETTVAARVTAEMLSSLNDKIGNIGQLTTTDKTSLVAAVNEVKGIADNKQDKLIAGENITIAADGKTISATGGGSSVPKPLTYDYMPEGYPTKSVQTITLMEEQEVEFVFTNDLGVYWTHIQQSPLAIAEGKTYTVNWDGTEYECVCFAFNSIPAIGNLSILGVGDDTGEPFAYEPEENAFITLDTSATHTISVKTTEETVTPMSVEFIPHMNVSAFTNDAGYLTLATLPKYEGVVE